MADTERPDMKYLSHIEAAFEHDPAQLGLVDLGIAIGEDAEVLLGRRVSFDEDIMQILFAHVQQHPEHAEEIQKSPVVMGTIYAVASKAHQAETDAIVANFKGPELSE